MLVTRNEGKTANHNSYVIQGVLCRLIGCSVISSAHVMTDCIILISEQLLLITIQLNHGSTLLSVSLQDAAHLSSVFSENHHNVVRVVLGYDGLQHLLSNIVHKPSFLCATHAGVGRQDILNSHL